jgi:phytoene dehydrogenase-like protein
MRAIIVGGGIGGLACAIALQRIGVGVSVYEQAAEIGEVGAAQGRPVPMGECRQRAAHARRCT